MFYVIYIFVIAFALYLIFHDRFGEEGQRKSLSSGPSAHTIPPEPQARVPLLPPFPRLSRGKRTTNRMNPPPHTSNPSRKRTLWKNLPHRLPLPAA